MCWCGTPGIHQDQMTMAREDRLPVPPGHLAVATRHIGDRGHGGSVGTLLGQVLAQVPSP